MFCTVIEVVVYEAIHWPIPQFELPTSLYPEFPAKITDEKATGNVTVLEFLDAHAAFSPLGQYPIPTTEDI